MKNSSDIRLETTGTTPWKGLPEKLPPRTEAELLKQEARVARKAFSKTTGILARCLGRLADPSFWTRNYPWKSIGAAAVAGFVVSRRLLRKEKENSRKSLRPVRSPSNPSVLTLLLMTGADILKGVGTSFLLQKVKSVGRKENAPPPPPTHPA